jgi:exopolyphosphatase / guanosine-5'-triphosphate,3'-diphosphate pyrophosphatase
MIENMDEKILAAIDLGTNSFHLVIVNVNSKGQFKVLTRDKEVVRLGSSSNDMKIITEEAVERGISTLKRFKMVCDSFNAEIRAIGTSAIREALNKDIFINAVLEHTGIQIEVVTGLEEARLIYLGVLQALKVFDKRILLIDIGGGSTEFLVGEKGNVLFANSVKVGAIRLTQRYFKDKKIKQQAIDEASLFVKSLVNPVVRSLQEYNYEMVVGTSGTITNIGMINYAESNPYEDDQFILNNYVYDSESLKKVVKKIYKAETISERSDIPGLDANRADIITAGAVILEQLFNELKIKKITVSSYALREGIIIDTISKQQIGFQLGNLSNVCYNSIITLAENCGYDKPHCEQALKLSVILFDFLKEKYSLTDSDKEYLEAAALLHDIGHRVSHSQHHKHSYYLIKNSEMLGFNDNEIEMIANIARYHRKSHPKPKHEGYNRLNNADRDKVRKLAGIFRIADGLDRGHKQIVEGMDIMESDKTLTLKLKTKPDTDFTLEIWGANLRKSLFEESFGYKVIIQKD